VTEQEILSRFTQLLRDLLADETIVLSMEARRADVPGWDSFMYVNFIVAVEEELRIKFRVSDVESFRDVGDIVSEARRLLG
jgi:acyl carrier protein